MWVIFWMVLGLRYFGWLLILFLFLLDLYDFISIVVWFLERCIVFWRNEDFGNGYCGWCFLIFLIIWCFLLSSFRNGGNKEVVRECCLKYYRIGYV